MAITNAFREAVASENVTGVRIMMKDSLLVDPTFKEFEEMERLAGRMRGDIYEKYDGGNLSDDTSKWTTDYMNRLMVELVDNFSRERIIHLKRVVRHLYPVPTPTAAPKTSPSTETRTSLNSENWFHTKRGGERAYRPENYDDEKAKDEKEGKITSVVKGAGKGAALGGFCGALGGGMAYATLTSAAVNAATAAATAATAANMAVDSAAINAAINAAGSGAMLHAACSGAVGGAVILGGIKAASLLLSDDGGR